MKYSFMSFSTPQLDLAEILEVAHRYGYDGIEPRLDSEHGHGIEVQTTAEQRLAIRRQAEDAPAALACLATSLTYANPDDTEEVLRQTHERIDLTGDVGVSAMRVFGGQLPDGFGRRQAIDLLVESLRSVADHAAQRGVTLCLETHDDWCDPAHVAEVLGRVDHPAIGANWDAMHPVRSRIATIDESFETLKPWIRHLHVHDGGESSMFLPFGEGQIDHKRVIELLKTIDFEGYLSGEWIGWEPYEIHLPREVVALKRYEHELS